MPTTKIIVLVTMVVVGLPAIYSAPSAYRKAMADGEVDRLCALDGGIKVFENVQLPADKFDQFGDPNVPLSTSRAAQASAFVIDGGVEVIVKGGSDGRGEPGINRYISKAVRVSDKKVLGIAVAYSRSGGDPPGPWHPSSYTGCTHEPGKQLNRAVFSRAS